MDSSFYLVVILVEMNAWTISIGLRPQLMGVPWDVLSSRKLRAKLMELLRGNAKRIYTRLERDLEYIFRLKRSCIESRGKEDGVGEL